jgi:hypothetical protein
VDAQRVGAEGEKDGAVSSAPLEPGFAVFAHKFEHSADGGHAGGGGFGGDAWARVSSERRRLWDRIDALPKHGVTPYEGQAAKAHIFARSLDEFGNLLAKPCLEFGVAERVEEPRDGRVSERVGLVLSDDQRFSHLPNEAF